MAFIALDHYFIVMKGLCSLILLLICIIPASLIHAQDSQESFDKHALVFSVGFGGSGYNINENYSASSKPGRIFSTNFGTSSATYPVSVEYALFKWLGIGVTGQFDSYYLKKDSISNFQPTAKGLELGLLFNLHLIRTRHVDFLAGASIGNSNFTENTDPNSDQLNGNCPWVNLNATLRYYFGRIGLYGSLGYQTMNYTSLTSNNSSLNKVLQYIPTSWAAKSESITFGLQLRL